VEFSLPLPKGRLPLERRIDRFPYVPGDAASRDMRCEEVYRIQVQGIVTRMQATGTRKLVIGVSGGLDSTQALLVCARAVDELKLPRRNILAYTMPGFATSSRTRNQAWQLMRAVGATAEEIDIRPSCMQMLKDIGHPYAKGKKVYDITFENVQAASAPATFSGWPTCTAASSSARATLRAGARLVHLRRRRPDVALQRERERAEDPDPVPRRLGGRVRRVQRRREACVAPSSGHRDQPGAHPRQAEHRSHHRPLRAAGFQYKADFINRNGFGGAMDSVSGVGTCPFLLWESTRIWLFTEWEGRSMEMLRRRCPTIRFRE